MKDTIKNLIEKAKDIIVDDSGENIKKELENIFNLSSDMIGVFNPDGRLLKINPSWEKVLGYTTDELLKMGWAKLVHPDDIEPTNKTVENQLKGGSVANFINRYRCKDGSYKTFEWRATPAEGGIVYAIARDITEQKESERDLKKKHEQLQKFAKLSIGREKKMMELKNKLKELEK